MINSGEIAIIAIASILIVCLVVIGVILLQKYPRKGLIASIFVAILLVSILGLSLIVSRTFSPRELDDVHPSIPCAEKYIEDSEWLWVIPLYMGDPITNYPSWCRMIKAKNKKLGMHGVMHTYSEFSEDVPKGYIKAGMEIFKKAFGEYPKAFKGPKTNITKNNKKHIQELGMVIKGRLNQILHNVYHCEESGRQDRGRLVGEIEWG